MAQRKPVSSNPGILVAILLAILALIVAVISAVFYMRLWSAQTSPRSYPAYPKPVTKTTNSAAVTVELTEPLAGTSVTNPIQIAGRAPGNWFFEATFPVVLEDVDGNELSRTQAQAVGDWMTTDLVEFTASLEYSVTQETSAVLVFRPDNPSGLPNTEEYRLPITLSAN